MVGYSFELALQGLRRFPRTSALAMLTVAIGLAASMTTLTLLHTLSADPLPGLSQHLYLVWVDTVRAKPTTYTTLDGTGVVDYKRLRMADVEALLAARRAVRQTAVADMFARVEGGDAGHGNDETILAATSDFIPMFGVALRDGRSWTGAEDAARTPVAVIDSELARSLFSTERAVGKVLRIKGHAVRVIGVSAPYAPQPHFFALDQWSFSGSERERVFMPYSAALDVGAEPRRSDGCDADTAKDKTLFSVDVARCAWLGYWVQLDTPQAVADYRIYLNNYLQQQKDLASFGRSQQAQLLDVPQWLTLQNVIPDNVRLNVWLAGSFLLLCMVNVTGLLAAKFMRRSAEVGIRRALGAPRRAVMLQHMIEAGAVCVLGGVLAWPLTLLGLALLRMQGQGFTDLARLDVSMFGALFMLAMLVGMLVGFLPAWQVSMVQPGLQVKSA